MEESKVCKHCETLQKLLQEERTKSEELANRVKELELENAAYLDKIIKLQTIK